MNVCPFFISHAQVTESMQPHDGSLDDTAQCAHNGTVLKSWRHANRASVASTLFLGLRIRSAAFLEECTFLDQTECPSAQHNRRPA